ncbi:uncharacterized protein [Cherax quadricarinatus]
MIYKLHRYTWWRGPAAIEEGDDSDGESGQLVLMRVDRHLSGDYTVVATSSHSAINSTFFINVQYGPQDIQAAERVTVDEDGTATVLCSATGNPTPNITWTRGTDNTSSMLLMSTGVGEARLVVEWASRADSGIYHCHASNVVSSSPPIPTAIVVTQEPTSASLNAEEEAFRTWAHIGGSGWLDCRVRAAPAPSFRWTTSKNSLITSSEKYFIHVPQLVDKVIVWSSVLEIKSVTVDDYTNYTCTAYNSEGSYDVNFTLGPPIIPGVPVNLNIVTVSKSVAIITWMKNHSGGEPAGYTVRYHVSDAHNYEFVDIATSNSTSTTIRNLTPGADYSFAILAYNEYGHSNFSSPPIRATLLGVVEEAASSSSNIDSQQPRVPLLMLLLISLTAAALVVLNVAIIVCFVRRLALKRNMSASSSKTTALEIYTPTSIATENGDDLPLTSFNEVPVQEYKPLESQTKEDCEQTSLISPHITVEPPDSSITPPAATSPRPRSISPLLNEGISVQSDTYIHANDQLPSDGLGSKAMFISSPKLEKKASTEAAAGVRLDKPDVCPVTSSSCEHLLVHQKPFNPYSEDDRESVSSHHSSSSQSYVSRQTRPKYYSPCHSPSRLTSHVIYHGQPHIQQLVEQQNQQQQWQQQQQHKLQQHKLQLQQHEHHNYQQNLPCCQQTSPHTDKQMTALHPVLNPARLSPSTVSCCDATCNQSFIQDDVKLMSMQMKSLQRDREELQDWDDNWLYEFNTNKCTDIKIGKGQRREETDYRQGEVKTGNFAETMDFKVSIPSSISPGVHINQKIGTGNAKLTSFRRCFQSLDKEEFAMEYAAPVWNPQLINRAMKQRD